MSTILPEQAPLNPRAGPRPRSLRDWIVVQLRARLLASLALSFLFIFFVDSFFTLHGHVAAIREQSRQFASAQIHSLQVFDYTRTGEDLQSFVQGRGIGYAEIRGPQGVIIASWSSSSRWSALQEKLGSLLERDSNAAGITPMWLGKIPTVVYSSSIESAAADSLGRISLAYPAWDWMKDSFLRAAIVLSIFVLLLLRIFKLIQTSSDILVKPIKDFTEHLARAQTLNELAPQGTPDSKITELNYLQETFLSMHDRLKKAEAEKAEGVRTRALSELASQVAHDIRSPLAALEIVSGDVAQLPEDKRILIRAAVGRIRDIANSLLNRQRAQAVGAAPEAPETAAPQLLSSLIDPVVSEKRLQFRSQSRVEIELRLDASSYGLFAAVQPVEFKRLVSNLVNNAVEAFAGGAGAVSVGLGSREGRAFVSVQDNGKGIPPEVLAKLGRRGETHGKAGGSGLGLHHARTSAESWGGSLEIASQVGKGTTTTVLLPLAPAPEWFVPELRLAPGKAVVVLDDDASIHQVWQGRLDALKAGERGVEVVHVSAPDEVRSWVKGEAAKAREALYLFDYELLGYRETGLSLAEELALEERVVLVTSRYEEPAVLEGCRKLKTRLIPKGLAGLVPMRAEAAAPTETSQRERLDAVLIDDDPLTRMTWKMAASRLGKKFQAFPTPADFLKTSDGIDRGTPVYVDAELGDGMKGEVESLRIHERGFGTVYLATGHEPEKFAGLKHLRGVIGKEPPWSA